MCEVMIDPVTIIHAAIAMLRITGLYKEVGGLLHGDENSKEAILAEENLKVANKIINIAGSVTGEKNPPDMIRLLEAEEELQEKLKLKVLEQQSELLLLNKVSKKKKK